MQQTSAVLPTLHNLSTALDFAKLAFRNHWKVSVEMGD